MSARNIAEVSSRMEPIFEITPVMCIIKPMVKMKSRVPPKMREVLKMIAEIPLTPKSLSALLNQLKSG